MDEIGIFYSTKENRVLYVEGTLTFFRQYHKDIQNPTTKRAIIPQSIFYDLVKKNPKLIEWNLKDVLEHDISNELEFPLESITELPDLPPSQEEIERAFWVPDRR
ncbi:MAG: hypothetical protein ABIH25_03425 [Candidatus Woesearchaeota archaeon]